MLTHSARAQNPEGEAAEGELRWYKEENQSGVTGYRKQENPQPHAKPPSQEEVSQPESARCGTPEGSPAA